jgi:hypothetical protein
VPSGATIVSGQGTTCITVNFSGSLGSNSVCGYSAICVRAMNACGLSQARCVNLYTAPTGISTLNGLASVNQGATTSYSLTGISGATSYNWIVPAGWTILNGQGSSSISVLVGSNSGYVTVTPLNACASGSMRMKYVQVNCAGFRDAEVSTTVMPEAMLYPNPANNHFTVESGEELPSVVEVLDVTGKVIFTGNQIRRIDSASWTSGIYFVRLHFTDEVQTKRIEIMH